MNFTQSFEQFSSNLKTGDLVLYAGIGIVLWVLFKDKLSPVQKILLDIINKFKGTIGSTVKDTIVLPNNTIITKVDNNDLFFKLIESWKQTRDLAEKVGCSEAVRVADEMFPFLSPSVCKEKVV
jgi:hypothetical protein